MSAQSTIIISVCIVLAIIIIHKIMGSRHPLRSALLSMLIGLLGLAAVNLFSFITGVDIPVSRLSLACSAFLGIPGVITMLMLRILL